MFTDYELEYLSGQHLGRLATAAPDGTLQVSPVGFGVNESLGTIDIGGYNMERSRKFRNVRDNGRVAFVVDDVYSTDPWRVRFLEIRGTGEALADPEDSRGHAGAGPIIRVYPARILTLALLPGDLDTEPHLVGMRSRDVGVARTEGRQTG
ncbi:PPOX class F420-dependent oxidoreductase [Tsukamurella sp. 8F]|uniref:PPOX class F420-dependent oxidoreductase n=1 Tax=unclassified Tsukamurella TaxID=2633480 RepID=UPI0023B88751|nr:MULTISPECIES: PPOX class F420-dependent oxidoreductase [unclassified Tsukamurella]MDF0532348.1 PPOX class F420-dependent oxidoreductase [Tsukamurella sp. 8J]MDF0588816.1 PPOX class F420-dependent oxidoreductase [Tsukamurella sp. 8F]